MGNIIILFINICNLMFLYCIIKPWFCYELQVKALSTAPQAYYVHTLPPRILLTLYNTLILPHLNYGLVLWGHRNERILKLQKRAIRTISNSKFNGHTEPICKLLSILKLPDMYNLQLYKMYYKIKREIVPQYFTTVIPTLTHCYFTRRTADQQTRLIMYLQIIIVYTQ